MYNLNVGAGVYAAVAQEAQILLTGAGTVAEDAAQVVIGEDMTHQFGVIIAQARA